MHRFYNIDDPFAELDSSHKCPSAEPHDDVDKAAKLFISGSKNSGQMGVDLVADTSSSNSSATVYGSIRRLITDTERNSYNITDKPLRDKIHKLHGMTYPRNAFVKDPTNGHTHWKNAYATAPCNECLVQVKPTRCEIVSLDRKLETVKRATFRNNSSVTGKFNVSITDEVTESHSSTWSNEHKVGASHTIAYKFIAKHESSISYERTWGQSETKERTITLGSSAGIEVELKPGESVVASLISYRGEMKVKVFYNASVSGRTLFQHQEGRVIYTCCIPIQNVVTGSTNIATEEVITVKYYSETDLVLDDPLTGKRIRTIRVPSGEDV